MVVAACVLAGGWFWLRDAAVVQVRDVFITGLSSSEAPSIRTALKAAALDMTTLHVREDQLRAAVAEFPSVAGVRADAKFPHKLTIEVRERAPVAAIETGAGRVAAAGDGRVLRGLKVSDLPILRARSAPAGKRVTDRNTLGALAVAGGAPPELRGRIQRLDLWPARSDARDAQRSRPRLRLRFRRRSQVVGGRPGARGSELPGRHVSRPAGAGKGGCRRARAGRPGARTDRHSRPSSYSGE